MDYQMKRREITAHLPGGRQNIPLVVSAPVIVWSADFNGGSHFRRVLDLRSAFQFEVQCIFPESTCEFLRFRLVR
jgi:hypothetical protein